MPSKEAIIDNISEYTAVELAGYIKDGTVTFEELQEEPDFSIAARKEVQALLAGSEEDDWQNAIAIDTIDEYDRYLQGYPEGKYRSAAREAIKRLQESSKEDDETKVWESVDKNDEAELRNFIANHPNSPYIQAAKDALSRISRRRYTSSALKRMKADIEGEDSVDGIIDVIKEYVNEGSVSIDQLYTEIREDHNWLTSYVIDQLGHHGILDFPRLEKQADVNSKFFEFITNNDVTSPVIDIQAPTLNSIGPKTTEFYFWGIPSSGKTCALGAIMSEARHGGYVDFAEPNIHCQGYHYMTTLSQIFECQEEVFKLPEGTQTDAIFEMSYVFKKNKMDYPVTFIDLAGETINSMYRENAGLPLTGKQKAGLETACRLLTGNPKINRKVHFFVLEYNGHLKKYKDLTQDTLLTGAMAYIKSTGIFKTETDAVYLLITKSDLAGGNSEEERNEIIADYIKGHYKQFYNGLRDLCETNEINEGYVDIIPFSLGDVCFQNLCLFDNATANTVVELIIERSKGFKTGKLASLINKIKG